MSGESESVYPASEPPAHTATARPARPGRRPGGRLRRLALLTAELTRTAVVRTGAAVTVDLDAPRTLAEVPADGTVVGTATYRSDGLRLRRVRLLAAGLLTPSPSPVP